MKLLGRRVLVQRDPMTEKIGSLYLPDRAKQRPQEGIVVSVGAGVDSVRPGDRVLFGRFAGVELSGTECLVIWERDLMAVLEEGSATPG